jgi:hypothetical protein
VAPVTCVQTWDEIASVAASTRAPAHDVTGVHWAGFKSELWRSCEFAQR